MIIVIWIEWIDLFVWCQFVKYVFKIVFYRFRLLLHQNINIVQVHFDLTLPACNQTSMYLCRHAWQAVQCSWIFWINVFLHEKKSHLKDKIKYIFNINQSDFQIEFLIWQLYRIFFYFFVRACVLILGEFTKICGINKRKIKSTRETIK